MPRTPLILAKQLWRNCYALPCFQKCATAAEYLIDQKPGWESREGYTLITGIYVLYARPFVETSIVGSLSKKIVPVEYRELHKRLIGSRQQVYAHRDPHPEIVPVGMMPPRVVFTVRPLTGGPLKTAGFGYTDYYAGWDEMASVRDLCLQLVHLLEKECDELLDLCMQDLPKEDGDYELNIADPSKPLFVKTSQPPE